jgi:hypothetical protein
MRPRSANEWRDFWRDGGERELNSQLEEFAPFSVRIATLLGSNAPERALVAELGRIREHELKAPSDPERDARSPRACMRGSTPHRSRARAPRSRGHTDRPV